MTETSSAFDRLRNNIGSPRTPPDNIISHADQTIQMTSEDGLKEWCDGPIDRSLPVSGKPECPAISQTHLVDVQLWAVRESDVVYADERGEYGRTLNDKVIKHTNLTGGLAAYCAGELLLLDAQTIVVTGRSGRYGPRSAAEMDAINRAFRDSGYDVWSMGYDPDVMRPLPFVGTAPMWIK